MKWAIALVALLCGCGHSHTRVHVEGGRSFATLLGLSILGASVYEAERSGFAGDAREVPELDPSRKVSEQDCTKPLDYSLGNIRCK